MKNIYTIIIKVILFFTILHINVALALGDSNSMRPIYSLTNLKMRQIEKKVYQAPGDIGTEVFPVLVDNAIGTTYNNSISLIRFKNGRFKIDVLKKDFSEYVGGVSDFLPVFSNEIMGYAQGRRFLLFNLNNSNHKYYLICNSIKERLIAVDVYDYNKKQFIFNISVSRGFRKRDFSLNLIDLSTDEPKVLKTFLLSENGKNKFLWEHKLGKSSILFDLETKRYVILDSNFQPTTHPLVTILNEHKDFKETSDNVAIIHPTLPFSVVMGRTKLWVASWKGDKPILTPIVYGPKLAFDVSISLDGKWVMYGESIEGNQIGGRMFNFYAFPIDESIPFYLNDPVSLGKIETPDKILWTIKPTSFIAVNQFSHITRWVLEDQ